MPLPAGLDLVTVTRSFKRRDGTAAAGAVRLVPRPGPVRATSSGAVVQDAATAVLDGTGAARLVVVATDSAGIAPASFTYELEVALDDGTSYRRTLTLPSAAPTVTLPGPPTSWRRSDLPDPVEAEELSGETPALTLTQQATSTIASAQALLAPDTGPFTYLGAGAFQFGAVFPDTTMYLPTSRYPNTYASGQGNWAVEFITDADEFEILFKYISSATRYRLTVDGHPVTDLPQLTGASAAGSRHVLKFDFGTAAERRIRFDFATFPFGGLFLPPNTNAWKPSPRGRRLAVLGDSITDGSSENTGAGIGTWLYRAARLLGITDVWDQARGGTGYTIAGAFATLANRVALDITPYNPDTVIVWAGYNDNLELQATIQTAAAALYASLKTAAPRADIVVIGCYSPAGTPAGSVTSTDATLKAAALAAGLPFVSPLTGQVVDGRGAVLATQGAWITTQNEAALIGVDGVHPNDTGHAHIARRVTEAITYLLPA